MIYTKTGDSGQTSLVEGQRVDKSDIRVQTYGEIDHLVGLLGFAETFLTNDNYSADIFIIQSRLFEIGSMVACQSDQMAKRISSLSQVDIDFLERKIDTMTIDLPEVKGFIIPHGSRTSCLFNIARTQTRRCERLLVECNKQYPQDPLTLKYLNRLSDYLFVLSRMITHLKHRKEKYFIARKHNSDE